MNRYEIDKVFLNYIRTNNIEVTITTDEHPEEGGSSSYTAFIIAFSPSTLVVSINTQHGPTQCLIYCMHIVSIIPKGEVSIIFDNSKGE